MIESPDLVPVDRAISPEVRILRFQRSGPGSIPGGRIFFAWASFYVRIFGAYDRRIGTRHFWWRARDVSRAVSPSPSLLGDEPKANCYM